MLITYQTGTFWGLKDRGLLNQSLKDLPRPLILKPQTSRNGGYLVSDPLSLRCPSESCPTFSPGSVWHLSFTRVTTPPNPVLPLSFSSSIVPGSEIQPGTASPYNSVISTSSILACTADKQPNTQVMNKSQYSTYTLTETRRRLIHFVYIFGIILQNAESNLCKDLHCIIWWRFKW